MRITLKSVGDLAEYFGREPHTVELPEGSGADALLQVIQERWGGQLPAYLWDAGQARFRGPVYLVIGGKVVKDLRRPMPDVAEVRIIRALAGG
jgi:hypothetical protein